MEEDYGIKPIHLLFVAAALHHYFGLTLWQIITFGVLFYILFWPTFKKCISAYRTQGFWTATYYSIAVLFLAFGFPILYNFTERIFGPFLGFVILVLPSFLLTVLIKWIFPEHSITSESSSTTLTDSEEKSKTNENPVDAIVDDVREDMGAEFIQDHISQHH